VLDRKLDPILPVICVRGRRRGRDFDRDGWQDLYATNSGVGSRNALYRNRGDGTFEDVAGPLGVAEAGSPSARGAAVPPG